MEWNVMKRYDMKNNIKITTTTTITENIKQTKQTDRILDGQWTTPQEMSE